MRREWWMSDQAAPDVSRSEAFFERLAWRLDEDPADPVGLADRVLNEIQRLRQRVSQLEGR